MDEAANALESLIGDKERLDAPTKYLDAIKRAEAMLCAQEDALRSLGADEPDAESVILTLRHILSNSQAHPPEGSA